MNKRRLSSIGMLIIGGAIGWLIPHSQLLPESVAIEAATQQTDAQPAATVEPTAAQPAADLADTTESNPIEALDWLTGQWVAADESANIEFACHFTKNNAFMVRSFRAGEEADGAMSGMQVVAWDPAEQHLRSWTFDSNGGFGEDVWSQTDNRYTIRTTYTLPDGARASSLNVLTCVDNDTFTWKSLHREIDGELQPDIDPITLVRAENTESSPTANEAGEKK